MPTPWGTDNTDEDYAPHMYIQHKFIGRHAAEVEIGGMEYRIGVTEDSGKSEVVCEVGKADTNEEKTSITVQNIPEEAKNELLRYLMSEDSDDNVDPEDQEHIRRAFGFPWRQLKTSLERKRKSRDDLNDFIVSASGGREDVDTPKQKRRAKRKKLQ